jgi:curved DNA-binding protein
MDFKDYYATLGVEPTATRDVIKRAYRTLARRYHPDVSKEPDAEARFKEVAEAHEALIDPERRAAYDEQARRHAQGQTFEPPPGWDSGHGGADGVDDQHVSDFFAAMFGRGERAGRGAPPRRRRASRGRDHHARLAIGLLEASQGAQRVFSLAMPTADADGQVTMQTRQLEVRIPPGVRAGQQLRLAGQGAPGQGGGPAGDLYLDIEFLPHPLFRVDGGDLSIDLPLAPWEAALGASVTVPTLTGELALTVPSGSPAGRRLRLKGQGLPGAVPGDLYAVLTIVLPSADTAPERAAYTALASAFADFHPRAALAA